MNITLTNVRLSFPTLWTPRSFQEGGQKKFGATALVRKDDPQLAMIQQQINQFAHENFKPEELPLVKLCLRDGLEKINTDGYGSEVMFIGAANTRRPSVVSRTLEPLVEEDAVIYAGCYVNMAISLWKQDNSFGKRVNANLQGLQFVADGDPFGEGNFDPNSAFQALDQVPAAGAYNPVAQASQQVAQAGQQVAQAAYPQQPMAQPAVAQQAAGYPVPPTHTGVPPVAPQQPVPPTGQANLQNLL